MSCAKSQLGWMLSRAMCTHPLNDPPSRKAFVMLQAYIDDSGTHDGAHNCVMAGYWGGVKEWNHFEWQWKEVLGSEGVEEFKAKQFWPRLEGKRVGPYKSWTDERHAKFIDRLLTIIEKSKITPFAFGYLGEEWKNLPEFWQRIFSGARGESDKVKPLLMPLMICIGGIVHYCKPGKIMHFVVDADPRVSGRIAEVFGRFKRFAIEQDGIVTLLLPSRFSILTLTTASALAGSVLRSRMTAAIVRQASLPHGRRHWASAFC